MTIPNVVLDEDIEPEWGNAVADAINALESAMSQAESVLSVIQSNSWVTTNRINNGAVTNAKLASGIDAAKLTTGTLPAARIGSGAITEAKIGSGAVTNAKLASGIDASKLTTGTLPAARIGSNAITTARIADGQVTNAKLASITMHQPVPDRAIYFYRLGPIVFFHVDDDNSGGVTSAAGGLPAIYRPASNMTVIMHRTSDGVHRDIPINANGSYNILTSDGPWTVFHGWRAAS